VGTKSLIKVDSTRLLFTLLQKDRIDVALNARLDGLAMTKDLRISDIKVLEPPLATRRMFPYLHKKHQELVPKLAAALRAMKEDGTFDAIQTRVIERFTKQ
jgi:polar amino acid transport system substrate-binding protein